MYLEITLREINKDNWLECILLEVRPEQASFVAPNLFSLVQALFNPSWVPLAIYHQETMIGFVMFGKKNPEDRTYWIFRLMIDGRHQGKGYGKAAMQGVIRLLQEMSDCQEISLTYREGNVIAENLYSSLGFRRSGYIEPWICPVLTSF
jgi:diamine N-acetyltransferase